MRMAHDAQRREVPSLGGCRSASARGRARRRKVETPHASSWRRAISWRSLVKLIVVPMLAQANRRRHATAGAVRRQASLRDRT